MIFCFFVITLAAFLCISDGEQYNRLCNGKGYRNSHGICECMTGFYGQTCEYKKCPYGPSWLFPPTASNVRNNAFRQCSDMGYCDPFTGLCDCRSGYDGRACERISCPTSLVTYTASNTSMYKTTYKLGVASTSPIKVGMSYGLQCSGHGVCKTLRDIARGFNGLTIVQPPIEYDNWDADRLQGCVCDSGWEGYDCSRRSCPKGRDPLLPTTRYDKEELFVLQCRADAGYFSILALGQYTDAIPYNSDPGYLKYALEALPNVGTVTVTSSISSDGLAVVCAADQVATTYIRFNSYFGDRPPLFLTRNTANTRQWPQGSESLTLGGDTPVLRMVTEMTLHCPICPQCRGHIFFVYKKSTSDPVDITASNANSAIHHAVLQLDELFAENWSNVTVAVSSGNANGQICSTSAATTTTIRLYSNYGNLPTLSLIDATYTDASHGLPANLTLSSNKGNGTLYECSNQGTCDYTSGVCTCTQQILSVGEYLYRAESSDGHGRAGGRGDCGHFSPHLSSCYYQNQDICNGHGVCANSTKVCSCYDGWFGVTCASKECPKGRAYFDEPISSTEAHQVTECSGVGLCDRQTGFCSCRSGFIGPACEIRDCNRDSSGLACSGYGTCINMAQYFAFYSLSYGNASADYLDLGSSTWDASNWYECLCNAEVSQGNSGNPLYPLLGPSATISGSVVHSPPIPGRGNWDCSLRSCPKGDSTLYGYHTVREIQHIACTASHGTSFYLQLFRQTSAPIFGHFSASQIKDAIEAMAGVGNVSVANVTTACDPTPHHGGFLVRFETIEGDLPLFTVLGGNNHVVVSEITKGVSSNEECSGPGQGYCDVSSGSCVCNKDFYSSDGLKNYGARGDCSYKTPYPSLTYNTKYND